MNDLYSSNIEGETGKGGGGHVPTEAKDNLKVKQTVLLLMAISEGEIKGIDDILLNGSSISNYSGKVSYEVRTGTADQTVIKGFITTTAPLTGVGSFPVELFKGTDYIYPLAGDVASARITFNTQRLMKITDLGDRVGYKVVHEIYTRYTPSGGSPTTWTLANSKELKGKTTKPYSWDIRIGRPEGVLPTDTWEVKVIRVSDNDTNDRKYSQTFLQQITKIYETALTYPKTALVGITIKGSEVFGGNLPEIKILAKGIKFFLPTNYTPATRAYNETTPWNGSFKTVKEYTDNLSWVIYYCLVDAGIGLGIPKADVDVGSFYSFAKYCDQLVSDGRGGQEPRYTIHQQFLEREDPPTFLTYLLSLGNANFSTNEFGQVKIVYDAAGQAITKQVSNANVIDGMFDYSSNDLEGRVSLANATFSDRTKQGETNTATEYDDNLISRYGLQTTDIVLLGCSSEAQAKRKCRWALWTNSIDTEFIFFRTGLYGASFRIGELVSIMDSENAAASSYHAVIKSFSQAGGVTSIVLDRSINFLNENYTASLILTDGTTIENRAISQKNGSFSTITISAVISPFVGSTILFASASLIPRTGKVVKIEKEENAYAITCVEHSESKYAYIDGIGSVTDFDSTSNFVNFPYLNIEAPVNLGVEEVYSGNDLRSFSRLTIDWDWDLDKSQQFVPEFRLAYTRNDENPVLIEKLEPSSYDILQPEPGVYEISVWAVNPFSGAESAPLSTTYNYRTAAGLSTLLPPVNARVVGTVGTTFATPDLNITWDYNTLNGAVGIADSLQDYIVEVWNAGLTAIQRTYTIPQNTARGGNFSFPLSENYLIFGSSTRSVSVKIYSRDQVGDKSNPLTVTFTNPHPVIPAWNVTAILEAVEISIARSTEIDVVEYRIYASTTASFVKDATTLVYAGADNQVLLPAPANTVVYYAISLVDSFGDDGAPISTESAATAYSVEPDTFVYTGLTFKPNNPSTNKISWSAGTASRNGETTWNITANTTGTLWTSGIIYIYYVPGNTTLSTSTSLVTALGEGGRILATYKGGTDLIADAGRAFTSGDMILAGTVGASQLVTNTAVITGAAQIADGIITNAHIANATIDYAKITDTIQSSNYNLINHTGWRLNKTGGITTHDLTVYDSAGNVVLASGSRMDFANLIGSTKPENNATVGAPAGTLVAGTSASTVVSNAANGNTAFSGTALYRSTGAPTNNPTPSSLTITTNTNGTVNISIGWSAYTQGAKQADLLMLFWVKGGTAPTINDSTVTFNVNTASASYYILEGVNPADSYSFGIAAARRTENGLEIGAIQTSSSAPDWLGVSNTTPNYTANINGVAATTITTAITNYNAGNDRNASAVVAPTVLASGAAIDHTVNTDGSVDISFEWAFSGANGDIDGFRIYIYSSTSSSAYTFGTSKPFEIVHETAADKRAFLLYGVPADRYYTFGVQAYRAVDKDINSEGVIVSSIAQSAVAGENPYQPSASVAFAGNVTGTINSTSAATVVSNASNGATAYSGTSNYRTAGVPTNNPSPSGITVTTNTNGTINIQLSWGAYTQGAKQADMFIIFWKKGTGAPVITDSSFAINVTTSASYYIFEGVNPADTYSFGIASARRTESGLEVGTIQSPTATPDWQGVGATTPNYTANLNGVAASVITTAVTNFNASNDRNSAAITAPTISGTGTAVDHVINTEGTADISFEWSWSGTEGDIDGFRVYTYNSTSSAVYTFGTTPASETVFEVPASKRAFILFGVSANKYYTFGVQAYRAVDKDIAASGVILSTLVKPTLAAENPYQPAANVAFAGNVTGTINGIAATNVNVWASISGTGKPADNATVGADWSSNLANKPTSLSGINSTEGTKLAGIANGATSNQMFSGTGTPAAGLGLNGDFYLDITTNLWWAKQLGSWSKAVPQFTSSNISTFIANAAIGNAQIGTAAIQTANIGDAQISTLKVAGNAITAPESALNTTVYTFSGFSTANNASTTYNNLLTLSPATVDLAVKRICLVNLVIRNVDTSPGYMKITISKGASPVYSVPFDVPTRQVAGDNTSSHTFVFDFSTTAYESFSLSLGIILGNGTSAGGDIWSTSYPPELLRRSIICFTGKR